MIKKALSLLIAFALLVNILTVSPVRAAESAAAGDAAQQPEYVMGEFEYRIMGDKTVRKAEGLLEQNSDIYVPVETAAEMAGFEFTKEGGVYSFYRDGEFIWDYLQLSMDEYGVCYKDQEAVPYHDMEDGSRWYSLIHLLRYLRAQFILDDTKKDDVAVIEPAQNKDIVTIWEEYGPLTESLKLSQKDLYITHGAALTALQASLGVVMDGGFDVRILVPFWGENAIIQDQYEDAILKLAEEDDSYVVENEDEFKEIVDRFHVTPNDPWAAEIVNMIGMPMDVVGLLDEIGEMKGYGKKALTSMIDLDAASLKKLNHLSDAGFVLGTVTEQAAIVYNSLDILYRSKEWKEDFLRGLKLLKDIDKADFTAKNSVEQIKDASDYLLKSYEDPIKAAAAATVEKEIISLAKFGFTTFFPGGALIGILDTCVGISDVIFNDAYDIGKTTFMLDCLLDVQTVAGYYLDLEFSAAMQEAFTKGCIAKDRLDRLRAWALLSLRIIQRSHAYAYSLQMEHEPAYAKTIQAQKDREVMGNALCLIALISDSENYDVNLRSLADSPLISEEVRQIRDDLSESIWRTCRIGGTITDEETKKAIAGASVDIIRSDEPEKIIATVQTDEQGRWELELDNRYDYTCSIHAVDEENQEYIKANEEASAEKIDKAKNYLDFHTSLSKSREERFYEYLRKNVVPKIGTCDGASFKTKLENKDMVTNGGTGLLSALVDDLDNDGSLEMVTVSVSVKLSTNDMLVSLVFGTDKPTVSIDLDLYELEDDQVVHADGPRNIGYMERQSHGTVQVSACQWEGVTYFYGSSAMDDLTTYGPHATAIYHPEGGKLVFDFVNGGGWGQSLPGENDNQKMHTQNTDFTDTALQTSHMEVISDLVFELEFVSYQNSNVKVSLQDKTFLEEALEHDYKTIAERAKAFLKLLDEHEEAAAKEIAEELRKKEEARNSKSVKTAGAVIEAVQKSSGLTLTMQSENVGDDGSYTAYFKTKDKARVSIAVDKDGTITLLSTEARTYTQTTEWIALKDAILRAPGISLPADAVSAFSGKLTRQSIQASYDKYKVDVHNVDNFYIGIKKN